jgi:hypothetical protein
VSAKKRAFPGPYAPAYFVSLNLREKPLWAVDKSCEVEKRAGKWTLSVHRFWEISLCVLVFSNTKPHSPLMRSGGAIDRNPCMS